jgi:hypothetical protein
MVIQPFQGSPVPDTRIPQGALAALATLGFEI